MIRIVTQTVTQIVNPIVTRALLIAGLAAVACAPDPQLDRCELGTTAREVRAADRAILGQAAPYPADGMLRDREDQLVTSQRARRLAAWAAVARALAPTSLAIDTPGAQPGALPAWHTWYDKADVSRLFHHLYEGLGPDGRRARVRFSDTALDDALVWNTAVVFELPGWPASRWEAYLASLDTAAEIAGVGGIGRVGYSPGAARHLLASYPEVVRCTNEGPPPAFADGPAVSGERALVRAPVALTSCQTQTFGPYFVASGETLTASWTTDSDADGANDDSHGTWLEIQPAPDTAENPGIAPIACIDDEPCAIPGPGAFTVTVYAGDRAVTGVLDVSYHEPDPVWAACLQSPFSGDAAVVKADWRRAQLGQTLPAHDTSAAGLRRRLSPSHSFEWGPGDAQADPGPDDIYTITVPGGAVYRLAALHLMTKELDHWLWITLWWSPDSDSDFGADRPAAIDALGGPWNHYKMCAVVAFAEGDPDPGGGFGADAPDLADALAAVHGGEGAPSWCANPYLELGPGNAATNCIGCHQHGGSGLRSEDILADEARFPAHGRTQVRNNFPADYAWATDSGDRLGRLFADVVAFYDDFE